MLRCEHTAHSTLKGTLQGVSRRSPGRSRPQERGRYGLTRQPYGRTRLPEGWVREFPHTPNSFRRHLYVSTRHSAEGLGRRWWRWPALRTSRPAMLAQTRGAEGASTRVVLLQLRLGIRAPTQGIFQYNNLLGLPKFAFSRHNYYVQEKLHSTRTPEDQHASPHRGNTDVRQYFYDVYVKSAESRSVQTYHAFSRCKQMQLTIYMTLQNNTWHTWQPASL